MVPFASLKKQAEILFRLICCEKKTPFPLKKPAEKNELQEKGVAYTESKGSIFNFTLSYKMVL